MASSRHPIGIVGGGPAGSVAALCLRRLGHEVVLFEKQTFPRYRIGESLLPGTLAILSRLGIAERVQGANFPKKRAATFIWGGGRPPWSFTFATPKTAPWVFDHAYQVTRAEYDQILLDAAREQGAIVHEGYEVTDLDLGSNGGPARLSWKNGESSGELTADWIINASGGAGVIARRLNFRRFDEYYRNMAVWSYFKGGKRYKGDLEGNIFSVTWKEGWIWIIPLKDDTYSVGVVTGVENAARIRELGPDAFYHESLKQCPLAMEILDGATQCDQVRVLRDWAYNASALSTDRAFLCGDSGCFIDPLFSQGVHLATYSAMMAAAAIDYLYQQPQDAAEVHAWYDRSYREAYGRYHKFLSAFYAFNEEPGSKFWTSRKIEGARDQRFEGKAWFTALTGQNVEAGAEGVDELEEGAATLAHLWQHGTQALTDQYDQTELAMRRVQWANELLKDFTRLESIRWTGKEVRLVPSFKVHPTSFQLERQHFIGDESGRTMTAYALSEAHRQLFESLIEEPLSFKALTARLKNLPGQGTPLQIVGRLTEMGFLRGFDKDGKPVKIRSALRFGGVGSEDDIS